MLKSPGQEVIETKPKVVTIRGVSTSTRVLVGVTRKGPMGLGPAVTSWESYVEQYGGFINDGWTTYAVYMLFYGNPGARLHIIRVAHYTDITDATSLTAVKASVTLNDRDGVPAATLKIAASTEGTHGNGLKVTIADNGASKFDITLLETVNGQDVERDKFAGLTMDPADVANYVENRMNNKGKRLITADDQDSATAGFPTKRPAVGTFPLTSGHDGLVGLSDSDFVGNSASRTGLQAMNALNELVAFAVPGKTTSAIHSAMTAYAETRGDRYAVIDLPFGLTSAEAIEYRSTTLGANSDYAEANWPHLGIIDPATNLRKVLPNSGFILAAMGRTFDNPAKGPWKVAAGITDGQMLGALFLENDEVNDVGVRDALYQAQINPIYFVPDYGICRMGSRTLTGDPEKKVNINERWTFLFAESSIKRGTLFEAFENIDGALFKKSERTIKSFLLGMWRRGGLKGTIPTEAFYVQVDAGNNPESEIRQGNIWHRVGLATHTPGQFQYFEFERDTRALEAELANAGL